MGKGRISNLEKYKLSYFSAGFYIVGTIMFLIGSGLLFIVAKSDLEKELSGQNSEQSAFPY